MAKNFLKLMKGIKSFIQEALQLQGVIKNVFTQVNYGKSVENKTNEKILEPPEGRKRHMFIEATVRLRSDLAIRTMESRKQRYIN